MLNQNIKSLRNKKGFTQEDFAIRLNVVRQTVSKWENGLSVPDAEQLIRIAEILEVSVNELLGMKIADEVGEIEINDVAVQLARINEHLAAKNSRWACILKFVKIIAVVSAIIFVSCIFIVLMSLAMFQNNTDTEDSEAEIVYEEN